MASAAVTQVDARLALKKNALVRDPSNALIKFQDPNAFVNLAKSVSKFFLRTRAEGGHTEEERPCNDFYLFYDPDTAFQEALEYCGYCLINTGYSSIEDVNFMCHGFFQIGGSWIVDQALSDTAKARLQDALPETFTTSQQYTPCTEVEALNNLAERVPAFATALGDCANCHYDTASANLHCYDRTTSGFLVRDQESSEETNDAYQAGTAATGAAADEDVGSLLIGTVLTAAMFL